MYLNHSRQRFKLTALLLVPFLFAACSVHTPRYSVSAENFEQLKTYAGTQAQVVFLSQSAAFDPLCRLAGPVELPDGFTIAEFIAKAFNDEFKLAGIYSEDGIKITGDIAKVEFSSMSRLINGYWNISLKLESSNGKTLPVSHQHNFKTNFDGVAACNETADAFVPTVQDLIRKAVFHPQFGSLLEPQEEEK